MSRSRRTRFKTFQDWADFLSAQLRLPADKRKDPFSLRRKVYAAIERERGRPLLVYFADIENPRNFPFNAINASDIDGFVDLVNKCPPSDSVDMLLHSPGGFAEETERIVKILRNRFDEVHFLIPHSAYSAATMLALSGDSITLHPDAVLGPIDPQIGGVGPAARAVRGFENAIKRIREGDSATLSAHLTLIQKYSLHLLEQCKDSARLSENLVTAWLKRYMFKGQDNAKITGAVEYFASYEEHLTHSRPIGWDEVKGKGLNIHLAAGELAELLREAYIMLKDFLYSASFVKMYESADFSFGHSIQRGRVVSRYRLTEPQSDAPQSPPAPPPQPPQQGG